LVKYDNTGQPASGFGDAGAIDFVENEDPSIAVANDGGFFGSVVTSIGPGKVFSEITRYDSAGKPVTGWGTNGKVTVNGLRAGVASSTTVTTPGKYDSFTSTPLKVLSDGSLLLDQFASVGGNTADHDYLTWTERLDPKGAPDPTYGLAGAAILKQENSDQSGDDCDCDSTDYSLDWRLATNSGALVFAYFSHYDYGEFSASKLETDGRTTRPRSGSLVLGQIKKSSMTDATTKDVSITPAGDRVIACGDIDRQTSRGNHGYLMSYRV
jgi:hypothetical protein